MSANITEKAIEIIGTALWQDIGEYESDSAKIRACASHRDADYSTDEVEELHTIADLLESIED